jgi:hypothetical protein
MRSRIALEALELRSLEQDAGPQVVRPRRLDEPIRGV